MRRTVFMLTLLCAAAVLPCELFAQPQKKQSPPPPPPSPTNAERRPPTLEELPADAQGEELNALVRGAFLTTRPKGPEGAGAGRPSGSGSNRPTGPRNTGPRTGSNRPPARTTPKTTPGASDADRAEANKSGPAPAPPPAPASSALGVGYTLYLRDASNRLVRVKPGREFVRGEGIRLAIEPNVDGYLYIFNTTDGRDLRMLYPHGLINNGKNRVSAHATYQLPPAGYEADFSFDEEPGVERLYVVVARRPLEAVETGAALVRLCASGGPESACEWQAPPAVMSLLQTEAAARKLTSTSDEFVGQPQTAAEQDSATRGITLGRADRTPSVILLNASPDAHVFVTAIDLKHK